MPSVEKAILNPNASLSVGDALMVAVCGLLVVFMMLSFQIMRTVLMIFEKTELLVGKLKEKRQDRLSLGQNLRRR